MRGGGYEKRTDQACEDLSSTGGDLDVKAYTLRVGSMAKQGAEANANASALLQSLDATTPKIMPLKSRKFKRKLKRMVEMVVKRKSNFLVAKPARPTPLDQRYITNPLSPPPSSPSGSLAVPASMLQGLYTCIVLVGAVLVPVGVAQDPKHVACPPTDEVGSNLQSQDTQNPDGVLTVTCHYAGGLDCHYLSGVGVDSDHACPKDLIDANGHTTINVDVPISTPPPNPSQTSQNVPATTTDSKPTVQFTPLPTPTFLNTASSSSTTTSTSTVAVPTSTGLNAEGGGSSSASSDIVTSSLASTTPAGSTSNGGQSAESFGATRKSSISGAMIAGIAVGVVVLLVLVLFAGLYTRRRRARTRTRVEASVDPESARGEDRVAEKREWMTHQEFSERQQAQELRVVESGSAASLRTAGIRQQYLRDKILAVQKILPALPSSAHISTPPNNGAGPHSDEDSDEEGTLKEAKHRNEILQMRIHIEAFVGLFRRMSTDFYPPFEDARRAVSPSSEDWQELREVLFAELEGGSGEEEEVRRVVEREFEEAMADRDNAGVARGTEARLILFTVEDVGGGVLQGVSVVAGSDETQEKSKKQEATG
ncbi:hypothetical protein B0H19DRAFT_1057284 [Mycena capillaripes]|nr:hypothetical protein B0H19DRAFT_1057284 [Mycena capillaripes]